MKPNFLALGLALVLLTRCTPNTEQQDLDAVERFYGGGVHYKKGSHFSTNTHEPQGEYLEMALSNYTLGRDFADLHLPASNCAYLVYGSLTPAERQEYSYLRINLKDSAATHTYTFNLPELAVVSAAATSLAAFMADLQQRDYLTATSRFNPAALGGAVPDSVSTLLAHIGGQISPFYTYHLQGYSLVSPAVAGPTQQLVRLYVETQGPENNHTLLAVVDPQLRVKEKFLYGLVLLK